MKVKPVKNKISFYLLSFLFLLGTEIHGQCYQYVGANNGSNQAAYTQVQDLSFDIDSAGTSYVCYYKPAPISDGNIAVIKNSSGTWVALDSAWFRDKIAYSPDIAVDKNGYPAVVYTGLYNKLCVARFNGTQWDTIGIQGFTAATCSEPKLFFDKNNTPYVVFREASSKISVMKYDGVSWVYVGASEFSSANSTYLNITADTAGTPYVAYRDGATAKATVFKYNGSSWVNVGLPAVSAGNAWFVTIALDNAGTPYVGYSDSLASKKVSVKKFDGTSWVYVGTQGFSPTQSNYHSIAIDPTTGMPMISFGEGNATGSNAAADVMKFNGSTWSLVGMRTFSSGPVWDTFLAVTNAGTPIVAVADIFNAGKATVMKYSGSSWASIEQSGLSPGLAPYTSMTVDNAGTPYVAFSDMNNGKKASVMYYNGSNWLNLGPPALTTGAAKDIILLHDKYNALYLFYKNDSLLGYRKINVLKYSSGSWTPLISPGSATNEFDARFDPNDNLYVAFSDSAYSNKISVKKYNGSIWSYVGSPGFTSVAAYSPSIDINASGFVYVSYKHSSYLWVASNSSGSWVQFSYSVEQSPDYGVVRVGRNGSLFVLYQGSATGGQVKLFQSTFFGWNFITGGGSIGPANLPKRISLELDEFGNQYFAYPYYTTTDSVKRRLRINARMGNQIFNLASPSAVNSIGAIDYPNLCFDTLGTLYAGYQDGGAVVQKLNTIRVDPASSVILQHTCLEDTAVFSIAAYSALPLTYQWQVDMTGSGTYTNLSNDATFSGVNTPSLSIMNVTTALCADDYRCAISNSCYTYYATVNLFNGTPYISFWSMTPADSVCLTNTPYILSGASPAGGFYSGYNVASDSVYTADSLGSFPITYTVTNSYGCTNSDTVILETVMPTISVTAVEPSCGGLGTLTITGSGTAPYTYSLDTTSQSSNIFNTVVPGINHTVCMTDSMGCYACTNIIVADSCDLVWPGDANDDSVANNLDILAIGIGIDSSATARSIVTNNWNGYPSFTWPQTISGGSNYKHIDCNGDGAIDLNDTLAVNQNFSLTHAFSPSPLNNQERLVGADLFFVTSSSTFNSSDIVVVEVWAGSSLSPVNDLYGIAFDVNYTSSLVQPGTEVLTFPNSWLGTPGTNAIKISKIDALASTAYGAVSRITHTNANGFGKIADFKFQLKSSIAPNTPMFFSISGYQANDSIGNLIIFNTVNDSIIINSTSGIEETNSVIGFTIAPNPFTSQTTIMFNKRVQDATIKIVDVLGKEMRTNKFSGDLFIIDKAELQSGIYFVEVFSTNRLIGIRKLVIQ